MLSECPICHRFQRREASVLEKHITRCRARQNIVNTYWETTGLYHTRGPIQGLGLQLSGGTNSNTELQDTPNEQSNHAVEAYQDGNAQHDAAPIQPTLSSRTAKAVPPPRVQPPRSTPSRRRSQSRLRILERHLRTHQSIPHRWTRLLQWRLLHTIHA